jgi:hypothetical protein
MAFNGEAMTDTFAVHLGGGAYLDASGKIVFGAPDLRVIDEPALRMAIERVESNMCIALRGRCR